MGLPLYLARILVGGSLGSTAVAPACSFAYNYGTGSYDLGIGYRKKMSFKAAEGSASITGLY